MSSGVGTAPASAITLHIADMTDITTAEKVRTVLAAQPSATDVSVSPETGLATLTYSGDAHGLAIKLSARTGNMITVVPGESSPYNSLTSDASPSSPETHHVTLRVDNVLSAGDADAVTDALRSLPAASNISVSPSTALATLSFSGSDDAPIKAIAFQTGNMATLAHSRRVTLRVPGLSHSTAVYVRRALEILPSAADISVDVNKRIVSLSFAGEPRALVDTIADATADALPLVLADSDDAEATVNAASHAGKPAAAQPHTRLVTLRVDGMTCDSCVNRVREALEGVDTAKDVEVFLNSGLATLSFAGNDQTLVDAVDTHAGKNATVVSVPPPTSSRSVTLQVDGMMCMGCVKRVREALESVDSARNVQVSLDTGLATLSYAGDNTALIDAVSTQAHKEAAVVTSSTPSSPSTPPSLSTPSVLSAPSDILNPSALLIPPTASAPPTTSAPPPSRSIRLRVDGMTCMGCVNRVREALESVESVCDVDVSLATGIATLTFAGEDNALVAAVDTRAGKKAAIVSDPETPPPRSVTLRVDGMTCKGCVNRVSEALSSVESASDVEVSLDSGVATLCFAGDPQLLVEAITTKANKSAVVLVENQTLEDSTQRMEERPSEDESVLERLDLVSPRLQPNSWLDAFTVDDDVQSPGKSPRQLASTRMRVGGMTCTTCVKSVENALLSVVGVAKASVQLLGRATVFHDSSLKDTILLAQAVEAAGFKADVLDTKLPGARESSSNEPTEFRIDFAMEIQAQNASKLLRSMEGVMEVSAIGCTASIQLSPGYLKSSILRRLESNGSFGKMCVRQSRKKEIEAIRRGENQGATDVIDEEADMWRRRFMLALSFFIPILITGWMHKYGSLLSMRMTQWAQFFLATPVQFISGAGFYRASYYAIRKGRASMDVLVALSTSIAYFSSVIVLFFGLGETGSSSLGHSTMFRVSAMITTMVLIGKWLESSAKRRAAAGVATLSSLKPDVAVLHDPVEGVSCHTEVPVNALTIGDVVRIIPGDRVPTDGEVINGMSAVDESMLTGESKPVPKSKGDQVIGGTLNGSGSMLVRTKAVGDEAVLSQIVTLVNDAQMARAPVEAYADNVSAIFVPTVIMISILVFLGWFIVASVGIIPEEWYHEEGKFFFSLLFALETMVIACPCALGLATPTAVMVACEVGTRLGVLFRGGAAAVEAGTDVNTVVFDKTGTLTMGKPSVAAVLIGEQGKKKVEQVRVLLSDLVFMVESESHHPLAAAICQHIKAETNWSAGGTNLGYYKLSSLRETPGCGIEASVNNGEYDVCIGSPSFVFSKTGGPEEVFLRSELQRMERMSRDEGLTVVMAVVNRELGIMYGLEDTIRPEARAVVEELHSMGVETAMVTGDGSDSGGVVASRIGIAADHVYVGAKPADKLDKVRAYAPACFVGDGVNDAPALTAATIGIAIGAGAPVAAESAPVVLVRSDLWGVVDALDLARETLRRIRLNFVWAIGYNLVSVPLAAGALYPFFRVRVPPMVASGAMALSSTCVVLSSLALRWYRPRGDAAARELSTVDRTARTTSVSSDDSSNMAESDLRLSERVQIPLLDKGKGKSKGELV